MKQVIDIKKRRCSIDYARRKARKIAKDYKFEIIDELIIDSLHLLLADLTICQIKSLKEDKRILIILFL